MQSSLQEAMVSISKATEYIQHTNSRPNFEFQTSIYRPSKCDLLCACRCHQNFVVASSPWMQLLLGSLFVEYRGTPICGSQRCSENTCQRAQSRLLKIAYFFPAWFLSRLVFFKYQWTPTYGHMMNIRAPRVVSSSSAPIFVNATTGNVEGMKSLFVQGLASPFDVDCKYGLSPLHVRPIPV